jgi:PAS domain S-box-containing protein
MTSQQDPSGSGAKIARVVRPYALAFLALGVALLVALAAQSVGLNDADLPLFLIAIAISVWYGNAGSAAVSVVVAALCVDYFFTAPLYSFDIAREDVGHFGGFVIFAIVIGWFASRRRRVERELRGARDDLMAEVAVRTRQASLLDLTHDTIFVRDMSDTITYWNRGAQELFGWSADQAVGRNAHDLLKTAFATAPEHINTELMRTGRWEGELGKMKADRSPVVVASRWSLQRDAQNQPVAILETNNDITQQKQAENRIRKLNADLERRSLDLEATNKELEAFAYSVSHDLRAPLRHVAAYSELLQKTGSATLDERSRRYVSNLIDSAKKMGTLIDDLLAFSRIGRAETRMTVVSLGDVAHQVLREIERETDGRDIGWSIAALPDVHGDHAMLRLALYNLVANALKFTRTRSRAEIEIGARGGADDEVVVFVRDNGVGFDMKYVNKLFGVFQRLHSTEAFEGTGIGLATVQRVIGRHGGRVWAEGAVEGGATFYFSLPRP